MKKLITVVLFLICLGLAEQGIAQNASYIGTQTQEKKEEKKKKKIKIECGTSLFPLKIASLSTNPPFAWVDSIQATKYSEHVNIGQGFGVELIKKVANDLNIAVRPMGFNSYQETLKALNNGSIDLFIGAYYDTRFIRTGNVFVTPSFFKNIIQVIFPAGKEKPVEKFEDLIGLKGVVRTDEEFYPLIYRGLPKELDIRQVSSSQEAFTLLMTGKVDYLLGSPYSAEAEARRFKIENDIVYNEKALADLEMFLVFSGNSKCLPLRQKIVDQLQIETKDPLSVRNKLIDQINAWGKRFADEKGLLEEETNPTTPSPTTQTQKETKP